MAHGFCTECGAAFSADEKFCTSCGQGRRSSGETTAATDGFGQTQLPMPNALPPINLENYRGAEKAEAIALINTLSVAQREMWIRAGQPDILLWPGGDFATWLGAVAPAFSQAGPGASFTSASPYVFAPPRSNGFATAGFVLSLVSLFTFYFVIPGLLGLIFGIVGSHAVRAFEQSGQAPVGRGLAKAAIVISIFSLLFTLAFYATP